MKKNEKKSLLIGSIIHCNVYCVDSFDSDGGCTVAWSKWNRHWICGIQFPLTRFGAEKNDFIKYLTKNKRVSFKYENESYHIEIDDVAVFHSAMQQ